METKNLKEQIKKQLEKIEKMILDEEEKNKIDVERIELDKMLKEYIKHI